MKVLLLYRFAERVAASRSQSRSKLVADRSTAGMEPPRRVALGGSVRGAAKRPSFSVGGAFETGAKLDLAALTVQELLKLFTLKCTSS